MLKRIIIWVVVYFSSYGLSNFLTSSEPSKIFFWIYAGVPVLLLIVEMILNAKGWKEIQNIAKGKLQIPTDEMEEISQELKEIDKFILNMKASDFTFIMSKEFAIDFVCVLAITWLITWIFNLEFFIAYQIITLILCFTE